MKDTPGATERWKGQVEDLKKNSSYQNAVGVDGEPIEFELKMFPGCSSLSLLREIQHDLVTKNNMPEDFKDRIIFMSMCNDIEWKKNDEKYISNAEDVELLVSPPTQAPGNRMQGSAKSCQTPEIKIQLAQLCEQAFFQHLVTGRNYYKIRVDEDDGWARPDHVNMKQ